MMKHRPRNASVYDLTRSLGAVTENGYYIRHFHKNSLRKNVFNFEVLFVIDLDCQNLFDINRSFCTLPLFYFNFYFFEFLLLTKK